MSTKFIFSEKIQTGINIFTGIMVMVVNLGISFFLSPYIVDTLGEEANGFTQLANNFVTYASLLTTAFNSMASRFISISYHKGETKKVEQYYASTLLCNIVMVLLLVPIAGYIVWNLENVINIESATIGDVKILFACVFMNFFIGLISSVFSISMYVKNRWYIHNLIELFKNITKAVALFVVYALMPPRIFYSSTVVVTLSFFVILFNRHFHKKLLPELKIHFSDFSLQAIREMITSGIWNTINQCGNLLMTGLDLLVTNLFISPGAMGVLSVAKTVPAAITGLASTLNSNLSPALTISVAKGNKEEILRTLRSGMKISSILVTIPYMVFCAFGVEFYSLWMPSLDAKMLTILSFLSCMVLVPWAGPQVLNNIFTATNRLKMNTITFLTAGLLNVGIVYLLLRYTDIGIIAVAGTSSVISILRCILIIGPYIAHLLELKWWTFYRDAAISVLCCAINFTLSRIVHIFIKGSSWMSLIVAVVISAILCLGADAIIVLSKKEREYLFSRIRRFVR